jgi:uncharacterized protein HemX
MTIDSGIVFGVISIVGSLIIAAVGYGAMKQKVESMKESQDEYKRTHAEEHVKCDDLNREKFKELYESRNTMSLAVERLGVLMEQVFKSLEVLNVKVDTILNRGNQ